MNKIILVAILFFAVTISQAQKNFYQAIEANGTTATYEGFADLASSGNGDGTYSFARNLPTVKLSVTKLPTGQAVGFKAEAVVEDYGDFSESELSDYGRVDSYPNVMSIKHTYTNDGYMMIDDLLFVLSNIPDKGVPSIKNVSKVYVMVKDRGAESKEETTGKKKKKKIGSLVNQMKSKLEGAMRTPTYRYISSVNIDKVINDYVAAMKIKQASPITAKDRADIAQIKSTREAGDKEIKMYNDSIKATPEYKKLKEHQARMAQMDKEKSTQVVTIINKTGGDIYIYREGFRNGTRVYNNSSTKVDCSYSYTYKSDSNASGSGASCYSANSGCNRSVTVN